MIQAQEIDNTESVIKPTHQEIYAVSQITQIIKNKIEHGLGNVSVKGEISGLKIASSGHTYFTLKDSHAILHAILWRGTPMKLALEDGLEVVCTGAITAYAERSTYQIIVRRIEIKGDGALLAILEKRKKELAARGLFDADRKKKLPVLPNTIGIVTSLQGAVIRDILHRMQERVPAHIIIWNVPVQGLEAAAQITAAVKGFNSDDSPLPKPDVIIIARGGGSIEDLWAFNDENLLFAVADSKIPIISAIGHETDNTLLDLVADKRAPTPTAAAEDVIPSIENIAQSLLTLKQSCNLTIRRILEQKSMSIAMLEIQFLKTTKQISDQILLIDTISLHLKNAMKSLSVAKTGQLRTSMERNKEYMLLGILQKKEASLTHQGIVLAQIFKQYWYKKQESLSHLSQLLASYGYKETLKRGFSLARTHNNTKLIPRKHMVKVGDELTLEFYDGSITVSVRST